MSYRDTPITGGDPEQPYEAYHLLHWGRSLKFGNPALKLVLQILCERADPYGLSYPGQKLLAEESEQKERAVREQLAILESLGVLVRSHRYDQRGKRTSDSYVLQARTVMPYTNFTDRVQELRRVRKGADELPAPKTGSSIASPPVDNPTGGEPETVPLPAPGRIDYRRPDVSTTGATAPGKYQRELPAITTSNHPEDATTAGEPGSEPIQGSSSAVEDDAEPPAPTSLDSDEIRRRALGASKGRRSMATLGDVQLSVVRRQA